MAIIHVEESLATFDSRELAPGGLIEIEPTPVHKGGGAVLFRCVSIDGAVPRRPILIKIFRSSSPDEVINRQAYGTIQELQKSIHKKMEFRGHGTAEPEIFPWMQTIPLFSFVGRGDDVLVTGYAMWEVPCPPFAELAAAINGSEVAPGRPMLPAERAISALLELLAMCDFLSEMRFVHADINPKNLLIDIKTGRLLLIDFESGKVVSDRHDRVTILGKADVWAAPEALAAIQRLRSGEEYSGPGLSWPADLWSFACTVHFLLFGCTPFFFVRQADGEGIPGYLDGVRAYLRHGRDWPDVDKGWQGFWVEEESAYERYRAFVGHERFEPLLPVLRTTFQDGFDDPNARVGTEQRIYGEWAEALRRVQEWAPPSPPSPPPPQPTRLPTPTIGPLTPTSQGQRKLIAVLAASLLALGLVLFLRPDPGSEAEPARVEEPAQPATSLPDVTLLAGRYSGILVVRGRERYVSLELRDIRKAGSVLDFAYELRAGVMALRGRGEARMEGSTLSLSSDDGTWEAVALAEGGSWRVTSTGPDESELMKR